MDTLDSCKFIKLKQMNIKQKLYKTDNYRSSRRTILESRNLSLKYVKLNN